MKYRRTRPSVTLSLRCIVVGLRLSSRSARVQQTTVPVFEIRPPPGTWSAVTEIGFGTVTSVAEDCIVSSCLESPGGRSQPRLPQEEMPSAWIPFPLPVAPVFWRPVRTESPPCRVNKARGLQPYNVGGCRRIGGGRAPWDPATVPRTGSCLTPVHHGSEAHLHVKKLQAPIRGSKPHRQTALGRAPQSGCR